MSNEFNCSLMHQFHRASQLADEAFSAAATQHELTPRQFVVLAATADHDGLSQTSIVKLTGIDRSTIADITRRMTQTGLLSRQRTKADARAYAVRITEQGRTVLAGC
ncbi:MAG: DNA-binding MarR family transcriptional regulator [Alphaproteobacteria bacterium]|jgi:DNA-binding MarR family transcriptional regulator